MDELIASYDSDNNEIIADDIIVHTEDYEHCFFEGIEIKGLIPGNIMEIDLFLGS